MLYGQRGMFVEHMKRNLPPYLPTTWASDISVHRWSHEQLFVMGTLPTAVAELQRSRDVFLGFLGSVQSEFAQKDTGVRSPHIIFSNARSDGELIKFVEEFGPVAGTQLVEDKADPTQPVPSPEKEEINLKTLIGAIQELATLRSERRTYAAALGLLAELRRSEDASDIGAIQRHISDIADGVWSWPEQQEAEEHWRASHDFPPVAWHFDSNRRAFILHLKSDVFREEPPPSEGALNAGAAHIGWALRTRPHRAGHLVLCTLINAFDTEVQYPVSRAVETLPFGSLRFGVRPALYLILKHLYLGGLGALVCANDRCRKFFESERTGQRFCPGVCSQRYRQRVYFEKKGSDLRKQRKAKEQGSVKPKK